MPTPNTTRSATLDVDVLARLDVAPSAVFLRDYRTSSRSDLASVVISSCIALNLPSLLDWVNQHWEAPRDRERVARWLWLAPSGCAHLYEFETLVVGCDTCNTVCVVCFPCTRCNDCAQIHPQENAHGCIECNHCETTFNGCRYNLCTECCNRHGGRALFCGRCRAHAHDQTRCPLCSGMSCCCNCVTCDNCGEPHQDLACGDCSRCEECGCSCTRRLRRRSREIVWHHARRGDFKRIPSRRWLGVEIELDGEGNRYDNIAQWAGNWSASLVSDGSLSAYGTEVVTSPAQGDTFATMLDGFGRAAIADSAGVQRTCGLHVHVDARDFSYYDLRRLIWLYAVVENALFETQPRTRRTSTYCKPCGAEYALALLNNTAPKLNKQAIIKGTYKEAPAPGRVGGQRFKERRAYKYDGARYAALNLHSWFFRGTVECRLHAGTARADKIIAWGALWATILDTAYRMTERDARALYDTFRSAASYHREAYSRRLLYAIAPAIARPYIKRRWYLHASGGWMPENA